MLKKAWKIVLAVVLALLVVALGYVAYVFTTTTRSTAHRRT